MGCERRILSCYLFVKHILTVRNLPLKRRGVKNYMPWLLAIVYGLLFLGGVRLVDTFRLREMDSCNITSEGSHFVDGYYGPRLIRPPRVPSTHAHTSFLCTYVFRGVLGQRVLLDLKFLRVGRFDYQHKRCLDGHLRLWDGLSRAGQYAYPPNTLCGHYTDAELDTRKFSSGINAEVEFLTETTDHQVTFTLTYKYVNMDIETDFFPLLTSPDMRPASAAVCDWSVPTERCPKSYCDITSPGHPGVYPPNMECQYHIFSQDPMSALQISFTSVLSTKRQFNIQPTYECADEYLAVYDGSSPDSPLIGRFCGQEVPDITTSGGHLFVKFFTGPNIPPFNFNGFHATVLSLTKEWSLAGHVVDDTLCDWWFNTSEGSISTPDHWLPSQTKCSYIFILHPGHSVEMLLAVYGLAANCLDRILIYEDDRMMDDICHSSLEGAQSRFQYHLEGSRIQVVYFTARGQYQSRPDRGFWLSFRQIRGARKFPIVVHLRDEAARYTVDVTSGHAEPHAQPFTSYHVIVMISCLLDLIYCST